MIHANATAFPDPHFANVPGMTKREYAAIHILAGLVGTQLHEGGMLDGVKAHRALAVELAVDLANRLMAEL